MRKLRPRQLALLLTKVFVATFALGTAIGIVMALSVWHPLAQVYGKN